MEINFSITKWEPPAVYVKFLVVFYMGIGCLLRHSFIIYVILKSLFLLDAWNGFKANLKFCKIKHLSSTFAQNFW